HRHDHSAHQLLEHRFLVLEVQVDRALCDTGALGDVIEPRRGKAARDELLHRRFHDGRPTLGRTRGTVRSGRSVGGRTALRIGASCGWRGCFGWLLCHLPFMTDWSVIVKTGCKPTN